MTDSSVISKHHRCASDLEVKSSSSVRQKVSSGHPGPEATNQLPSARDPVWSKSTGASERIDLRPLTGGQDDPQELHLWQGGEHSPENDGHKASPEVTEKHTTLPSGNRGKETTGSGRMKQSKEGGDAEAEGGTEHETSFISCLEGSSSSSSQATYFSVTDCSMAATDQEKKRVSFGDCNLPCVPEKKSSLHSRSILKAATVPPHVDSSAAVAEDERGVEGRGGERTGARHGRWTDLEADKLVNSASLTKKRLKKRSLNSPSHQHRQSPVLLILSGHFSTPRRNHSAGVAATEAGNAGRRRSEPPSQAAQCRPGCPTDIYLSGSRRGHRPQTPPPQRRRRCLSAEGIVNQSYKEDDEDREDGEEADNERNAERLRGGGRSIHEGRGGERKEAAKMGLSEEGSTCYLVHLRDTDRIPKHVDHIIRKFNLRLLEPENDSRNNNIVDVETPSSATRTGREMMKSQQHPLQHPQLQPVAANIAPKNDSSEEKVQNSSSTSCLEQETSKARSLSLRRRLSLRFSKKTSNLDKSKSVPGPSIVGQGGVGGGGSSREETATGPAGSIKRQKTSGGFEESKDTESSGAAGSNEDQAKTSEAVTSDTTYRAQKKAPRWRKLSVHIFRKSRDRVTEEAEQHPQSQQQESKESSDASSRDKNDGSWTAEQSPPAGPAAGAETSEGTGIGLMMTNVKRTSSETSKVLISGAQQKTRSPATGQDPAIDAETMIARPAETRTGGKTESNRELTLQQRLTSQSPWTTKTMTQTSSSDVIVPLVAKTSLVFQDAVFYFPSQDKDDDDGPRAGLKGTLTAAGAVKSEGKVPKPSKSSSLRLPLKGAISETRDEHQLRQHRSTNRLERHRSSLLLRRIRAFFGRSSGSAEEQEAEERMMMTEEMQLLMKQDIEMEAPCKNSSSLFLPHPTASAPPPQQPTIPLVQTESLDSPPPFPPPPPPPPPPSPHQPSSSSTLSFARCQNSSEN